MSVIKQFSESAPAALGFFIPLIWIAYKLGYFKGLLNWYVKKDNNGIALPALLSLLFPFLFTSLFNLLRGEEVSKPLTLFLSITTSVIIFILNRFYQFDKDIKQKEEAFKFYLDLELFNIVIGLLEAAGIIEVDLIFLTDENFKQDFNLQLIKPLDEVKSLEVLNAVAPRHLSTLYNETIFRLKGINKEIVEYNKLVDKRERYLQSYDNYQKFYIDLISIDSQLFRYIDELFVNFIKELSSKLDLERATGVDLLKDQLPRIEERFNVAWTNYVSSLR
jgi:hypothetical protein